MTIIKYYNHLLTMNNLLVHSYILHIITWHRLVLIKKNKSMNDQTTSADNISKARCELK